MLPPIYGQTSRHYQNQDIHLFAGDVADERDALEKLIKEDLQTNLGRPNNLYLEPLRWETRVTPGLGDIQERVFNEIGPYDIFIGIFWKRFGTPSGEHQSGSEAEFRDAYAQWEEDPSRPVMMYFCDRPFLPKAEDLEQFGKVLAFRKELEGKGLNAAYTEITDFVDSVRRHLNQVIRKFIETSVTPVGVGQQAGELETTEKAISTPHHPEARARYLRTLLNECQVLPLAQLGGNTQQTKTVTLRDVYVGLSTTTPEKREHVKKTDDERETRYMTAQEAAEQTEHMVLLGGPGSGKSTFVKHYIAGLAQALLNGMEGSLPVFVMLRDLAPRLAMVQLDNLPTTQRRLELTRLVIEQAISNLQVLQIPEAETLLRESFLNGDVHLVLDGLDEVPYELRGIVREAAGAVLASHALERVLVTVSNPLICRRSPVQRV